MRDHTLKDTIDFYSRCDGWISYASDEKTVGNICAGVNLGILEINEYQQARIKSKEKAYRFLNS